LCLCCVLAVSSEGFSQQFVTIKDVPDTTKFWPSKDLVDKNTKIRLSFSLAGFNKKAADAFFATLIDPASPNFHRWIRPSTFASRFGPSTHDIEVVSTYLRNHGFERVYEATSGLFVSGETTLGNAEKVLQTKYQNYQRPGELVERGEPVDFFAPSIPAKLPGELASKVTAVHGLSNLAMQHPASRLSVKKLPTWSPKLAASGGGYVPAALAIAYDSGGLEKLYKGAGMNVGIYSPTLRDPVDVVDFAKDIQAAPFTIYDVLVDGGPTNAGSQNEAAIEAALDMETIAGQVPEVNEFAIEGPGATETMAGELDSFDCVGAIGSIPVLSSSWDFEEATIINSGETSFATDFENVCESLASYGVTILVASGDSGAYSNSGSKAITTKLESSCPYVTSVGGTALTINPSTAAYVSETPWNYDATTNSGGGGGLSKLFTRPTWQTGPGVANSHSTGKRQLPDVSANASPATGYEIVANGEVTVVGGTSASTPLWAANMILLLSAYDAAEKQDVYLGLINPGLYYLGDEYENPTADYSTDFYVYHDIKTGSDGVYASTADWDYVTGWGSADFGKLCLDLGFYFGITGYLPDYAPFKPTTGGWTNPLMIHASATTVTEPTSFSHTATYYLAVCSKNLGPVDGPAVQNTIKVDGVVVKTFSTLALPESGSIELLTAATYKFTAGTHTVTFTVNSANAIKEKSTTNNAFTRTIKVV
jgi:kumamolisin